MEEKGHDGMKKNSRAIVSAKKGHVRGFAVKNSCVEHGHKCATCNERWRIIKRWGPPLKLIDFIERYTELHPNERKKSLISEMSYVSGYPEKAIRYVIDNG